MKYLNIDKIKRQCNIDRDFEDDDNILEAYGDAAEAIVAKDLGYDNLYDVEEEYGQVPVPIYQAMMMLCAEWYANRETVSFSQGHPIPYSYDYLLSPYRKYTTYKG